MSWLDNLRRDCIYCGEKVGVFDNVHSGCSKKKKSQENRIIDFVQSQALANRFDADDFRRQLNELTRGSYIQGTDIPALVKTGWQQAVGESLEDHIVTDDEANALVAFADGSGYIDETMRDANYPKLYQAHVIGQIVNGHIECKKAEYRLPLNFMKSESLVEVFDDVNYYEVVTRSRRVGRSHGVSIRVAKGLYYSPRSYQSETRSWNETHHVDQGMMALTTKHVYFHGSLRKFRVKYDRVVSYDPYSDGFGLTRDVQNAKEQIFVTGEDSGWFVYNLVVNLSGN